MKTNLLIMLVLVCFMSSCTNNMYDEKPLTSKENLETGMLTFYYKNKCYSSEYQIQDSTYIFSDEEVNQIFQNLAASPTASIYLREDGIPEYFDTSEEMEEYLGVDKSLEEKAITRAVLDASASLIVYEHANYVGRSLTFSSRPIASSFSRRLDAPEYDFNDIISSAKLTFHPADFDLGVKGVATFYRDADYQGASYAMSVSNANRVATVANFKSIPIPNNSRNFNDRISSLQLVVIPYNVNP